MYVCINIGGRTNRRTEKVEWQVGGQTGLRAVYFFFCGTAMTMLNISSEKDAGKRTGFLYARAYLY